MWDELNLRSLLLMNGNDPYAYAAQEFWELLKNVNKKQPKFEEVFKLHQEWRNHHTDPEELKIILKLLQSQGEIKLLHKDKKNKTRITKIILLNIDRSQKKTIREKLEAELPVRHITLKDIELSNRNQITYFKILNQYLLEQDFFNCCSSKQPLIPAKELSLEIFGDEKYIDEHRKGNSLFSEKLKLDNIGCRVVSPPPLFHSFPVANKPVLILENFASYWSFCKINDNTDPLKYSVIWYGDGNNFPKQNLSLDETIKNIDKKEIFYLGDIDPHGIVMPTGTNSKRKEFGLPLIKPSLHYYHLMLKHGKEQDNSRKRIAESTKKEAIAAAYEWFSEDQALAEKIIDVIERDCRIPQECIGLKLLQQKGIFQ